MARGYARANKPSRHLNPKFVLPDKHAEQVFNALTENPELMQGLHNVIETLDKRGIKLDREPTVAQMWQMFKDKEVVDSLKSRNPPLQWQSLQSPKNGKRKENRC
jgi:hypothetical protein